ncbi:MAG: Ycf66 family protein [Cyanobacteria bacterium P01_G01_bin.54]
MLAHLLAIAVAGGSLSFYLALFLVPRVYRRQSDFIGCGLGLFYALVLWICSGRITGGVLLGQTASVALLGWLGWQTSQLRRTAPESVSPPELPTILQNLLGPLRQRLGVGSGGTVPESALSNAAPSESAIAEEPTPPLPTAATDAAPAPELQPTSAKPAQPVATGVTFPVASARMGEPDEPANAEPALELTDLAADTPELAPANPVVVSPAAETVASESPATEASLSVAPEAVEPEAETLISGQSEASSVNTAATVAEPPQANAPSPTENLPPTHPMRSALEQDLSEVPEPAVISGLQDLADLAAPQPPETVSSLAANADVDLDRELWDTDAPNPTSTSPNPPPQQEAQTTAQDVQPQDPNPQDLATAPQPPPLQTIEAEVSTSFADRLVEADFNPEEEDIVDATVISSSPAEPES